MADPETCAIQMTVLSVERVELGKIFALASVEVVIDGIAFTIHGVQARRAHPAGTQVELPKYRDGKGGWTCALSLPEEIKGPMGDAVLEALVTHGLAKPRFDRVKV